MELRNAANSRCPRSTYQTSSAASISASTAETIGVTSQSTTSQPQTARLMAATSSSTRMAMRDRKLLKTMARHLAVQRGAPQAQRLRGAREIALELRQRALDGLLLELVEVERALLRRDAHRRRKHDAIEREAAVLAHDHRALHRVLQFPHIARPGILLEPR